MDGKYEFDTKVCSKCDLEKSLKCFNTRKDGRGGYRHDCKECVSKRNKVWRQSNHQTIRETEKARYRARRQTDPESIRAQARVYRATAKGKEVVRKTMLQRSYGITLEQYNELLAKQGGCCAICGAIRAHKKTRHLVVDHCHHTGQVRGLLCQACNTGIGRLRDSPELIQNALSYLTKPPATNT